MNTKFIAEISSNHNRDLERCKSFIKTAADIGCWGVKFQLFKIEELFTKEVLEKSEGHRNRKHWELPVEFLPELKSHCQKFDLKFGCTPFYLEAVSELEPYVDFYKVASYELLWLDLFRAIANTGKNLHFSTGIANLEEIKNVLNLVSEKELSEIVMYHCTSSYPTPLKDVNLSAITTLQNNFSQFYNKMNLSTGLSDHSVNTGVISRAVNKFEVEFIEFHLDLDKKGFEFEAGHCWLPSKMKEVIETLKDGFIADGNGVKEPQKSEIEERNWRADPLDGLRPLKKIRNISG